MMRPPSISAILFALLLMSSPAYNQPAAKSPPPSSGNNESEIRALYDQWAKAFEAHDIDGIMAIYAPGDAVIAYDVVAPLEYKGKDAYRKDYIEFLSQYDGPIHVEYRDMRILRSGDLGVIHALERFTGKLKGGQPSEPLAARHQRRAEEQRQVVDCPRPCLGSNRL